MVLHKRPWLLLLLTRRSALLLHMILAITRCKLSSCWSSSSIVSRRAARARRLVVVTMKKSQLSSSSKSSEEISTRPTTTIQMTTLPGISSKIQRTFDPCVVLMKELIGQYADDWKDKGGIFSLAQGVVYWKPPPGATKAMQEALEDDESMLHMYGPDEGLLELREALQDKLATENGLNDHDVMVTVGANQAYVNCVLTLLDHDTDASSVVFAPYYFNHVMALQMTLPEETSLLVGPSSDQGIPDLDWLESKFQQQQQQNDDDDQSKRIKVVTIVNPGNPTGTNLSRSVLQRAVDLCRQYNCWLILDCTYEYFVNPNDSCSTDDDESDENGVDPRAFQGCFDDDHVLHIFSFSKSYALAGYRCGYIAISKHAPHDLYNQMMKVQDTIPIAPSRIAQVAALGAMSTNADNGDDVCGGRDWVWNKVATLDTGRNAILQALQPLEHVTGTPIMGGSGAMYVMAKLPKVQEDDQQVGRALVRDYGIAVIPGSFCGFPGWIRVCYSNLPPQKCLEAAARLEKGIRALIDEK